MRVHRFAQIERFGPAVAELPAYKNIHSSETMMPVGRKIKIPEAIKKRTHFIPRCIDLRTQIFGFRPSVFTFDRNINIVATKTTRFV